MVGRDVCKGGVRKRGDCVMCTMGDVMVGRGVCGWSEVWCIRGVGWVSAVR